MIVLPFPLNSAFFHFKNLIMLWCKWRLFIINLHWFPIVLFKWSKNSHWNNDFCHTTVEKIGREVMPQCFLFESKSTCQHFWLRDYTTLFPFLVVIPHTIVEGASGHTALSKGIPCLSQPIKGRSTWAKCKQNARNMQETHENHASISSGWFHSSVTFLHFSIEQGYYLCCCHVETMVWCWVRNCLSFINLP